ncbi:hypothetical protein [Corallincola luteus]|uniref:hypothetical protein n=1 Tax=Corallincola luteus TaxID=1775177 RepID=UPI0013F45EF7|nr:hypothetical protein [Corallincola luteus]
MECYKAGIGAITLPVDVLEQMISHPGSQSACMQFDQDWRGAFGSKLSFQA